jgi:L-cysteine S-thiosulfotransferase
MSFLRSLVLAVMLLISAVSTAQVQRQSGNDFLGPDLLKLQKDTDSNPVVLWVEQGQELWNAHCVSCHQSSQTIAGAVVRYPQVKMQSQAKPQIWNIEDQIVHCFAKTTQKILNNEDQEILALSTYLSDLAKGLPIQLSEPSNRQERGFWQEQLNLGAAIYVRRQGRLNLSCTQCHDQNIGKNLRSDVISPAYLTGFPIYRQSWQTVGSVDRRLRACYSGVQAAVPATRSPELRAIELFLKKRSEGMGWDGPSLRR